MKTGKKSGFSQLWRRNAVVAAIALFVCAAVYLNWSYEQQQAETGKTLGESTMVDGKTGDALLGDGKTQTGTTGAQDPDAQPQADPKEGTATSAPVSSYFATARLNRQQARDSALSLLQDAAGEEADQTMRDQANESIQTMADYTVTEAQIENLVVAKGYADCVAFIGEGALSLAVAAPDGGLTDVDTARIVDVVGQVSEFTASQIHIIEVE